MGRRARRRPPLQTTLQHRRRVGLAGRWAARHAHEWDVFRDVKLPDAKYLIPGVIESTNNFVEHPRVIAQQRLGNYARLVGAEWVMAGSDCGFGNLPRPGPGCPQRDLVEAASPGPRCADGKRGANARPCLTGYCTSGSCPK